MRIIAGQFKGRKLATPKNDAIRPTADRTREALFNLLMHGNYGGAAVIGQRVADLCCGTGALGLEALSRGALECIFVDQDKSALALAKDNALHCNIMPACQFMQADVTRLPPIAHPVQLALMDAPYATDLTAAAYQALCNGGWLAAGALFIVEQPHGTAEISLPGAALRDVRQYGKAWLRIYEYAA